MNYYIQGNKEKAEEIKAAFGKFVSVQEMAECDFSQEEYLFYTGQEERGTFVYYTWVDCINANIIKTHPDYKELELPVEPKFKVGDWIVRGEGFVYEPSLITEIRDYYICELLNGERVTYTLNDVHKNFHLWAIEDAKDGDIIGFNDCTHNDGSYVDWVGIYKGKADAEKSHFFHCVITSMKDFRISIHSWRVFTAYPATKEQRDLLFQKMKEAGYKWDADKKELRKIKPHYDIANFKPFDKVLVRQNDSSTWGISFFGFFSGIYMCCSNVWYEQCIL